MGTATYGDWPTFVEEMRQLVAESKWSNVLLRIGDDYETLLRLAGALNLSQEQIDLMKESCSALAAKRQAQGDFFANTGLPRPQQLIMTDAFGRTPEEAESDRDCEQRAFGGGTINDQAFYELMDRRNMRLGGRKLGWLDRHEDVTTGIAVGTLATVLCCFIWYGWFSLGDSALLWIVKLAVAGFVGSAAVVAVFVIHTFLHDGLGLDI